MSYYNKDVYNELDWLNKISYFDDWSKKKIICSS